MGQQIKISAENKIRYAKEYLDGKKTVMEIAGFLDINRAEIKRWINRYQALGESCFEQKKRSYSRDLKDKVARDYLDG